jgi:hypothetical protein
VEKPVEKALEADHEAASNRCDVRFAPSWCVRHTRVAAGAQKLQSIL